MSTCILVSMEELCQSLWSIWSKSSLNSSTLTGLRRSQVFEACISVVIWMLLNLELNVLFLVTLAWIGFYDCIRPLTSHEDALYDPIVEDMFNNPSGQRHWDPLATGVTKEELKKKLMARWRNPSLTIHQVDVSGPKNRTVIPRSAKASVSMRIVPDQEVADITKSFEEHVRNVFGQLDTENEIEVMHCIDSAAQLIVLWWPLLSMFDPCLLLFLVSILSCSSKTTN